MYGRSYVRCTSLLLKKICRALCIYFSLNTYTYIGTLRWLYLKGNVMENIFFCKEEGGEHKKFVYNTTKVSVTHELH